MATQVRNKPPKLHDLGISTKLEQCNVETQHQKEQTEGFFGREQNKVSSSGNLEGKLRACRPRESLNLKWVWFGLGGVL